MVHVTEVTVAFRRDTDVDGLMARAAALQAKGQFADAIRVLNDARKAEPDNAEVLGKLGGLLMSQNRPAEALHCFERLCQVQRG
jgi:Tfp pilus assembly protein PilF